MKLTDYISVNPAVCHGKACIKGTRVMVSVILDNLAAGATPEQVQNDYPSVSLDAIRAAIAYAAELSHERIVGMPSRTCQAKLARYFVMRGTMLYRCLTSDLVVNPMPESAMCVNLKREY